MEKIQGESGGNQEKKHSRLNNKFILFILALLALLTIVSFLYYYFIYKIDRNSYFTLLEGNALLNKQKVVIDDKELLEIGDTIRTLGEQSFGVIEWGDGSITRLGGDTIISVDELLVSDDGTDIRISFDLLKGRTWSTVISFLDNDSYFRETFQDNTASVRGTIFNVDLTNEYLQVTDHEVAFETKDGDSIVVGENQPFSLQSFSFIDLATFIKTIKDAAWEDVNKKYDTEYLDSLKTQIKTALQNGNPFKNLNSLIDQSYIPDLSQAQKDALYTKLLAEYQKLNFIDASDEEVYDQKLKAKAALLNTANEGNKKTLLESIQYDIQDLIKGEKIEKIKEFFGNVHSSDWKNLEIPTIDIPDTVNTVKEWKENADGKIHDALDSLFK